MRRGEATHRVAPACAHRPLMSILRGRDATTINVLGQHIGTSAHVLGREDLRRQLRRKQEQEQRQLLELERKAQKERERAEIEAERAALVQQAAHAQLGDLEDKLQQERRVVQPRLLYGAGSPNAMVQDGPYDTSGVAIMGAAVELPKQVPAVLPKHVHTAQGGGTGHDAGGTMDGGNDPPPLGALASSAVDPAALFCSLVRLARSGCCARLLGLMQATIGRWHKKGWHVSAVQSHRRHSGWSGPPLPCRA